MEENTILMLSANMEILRFQEGVILKEGLCVNLDGWDSGLGGWREYPKGDNTANSNKEQ